MHISSTVTFGKTTKIHFCDADNNFVLHFSDNNVGVLYLIVSKQNADLFGKEILACLEKMKEKNQQ